MGHVYICQTTETGKDKQVADYVKSLDIEFFLHDTAKFVIGQEASVYMFQMETVVHKRIMVKHVTFSGIDNHRLEKFEGFGGTVRF